MKKRKIDKHYILLALVCVLITVIAMIDGFNNRGYFAIGGEIFIVPLIFLIRFLYTDMKKRKKPM
ncbi:hypothetical protein EQF93_02560 [Helcococcus ovis]|uniref:hypothetical protein n=1 Tax=Helcococcus ovis TaxID=72026 RepID=UPI00106F1A86|nr:hypothetical protein [Helcococcus ovis]TFF68338.1 hypothetical protein EQF93_02560 [Helcococcus ovis]WNZ00910.1 hypothetical protein EQF90_006490 [Helcococcus ovis]